MLPKYHMAIGAIVTSTIYIIYPLTLIQAAIIFLSSFLIDVDHYMLYVVKNKDFSLRNARRYFFSHRKRWLKLSVGERKNYKRHLFIFHGIELWIPLVLLANYFPLIWFVLTGLAIHIFLDYIDYYYFKEPFYPKFSQLYVYQTNKKKIAIPH